ncbi:unnamed protein product [Paramecium pentaurelia]|uniref:Protein kinase domain-containing protein n=1 Tax=Paramecium pentaurelia TaxID=43138 RepID=A0A8S1X4E5_9CILI|nr:unnamed protein product [Paramecium pentaurelia]
MFTGEDIQFLQQLHQLKEISKIGEGSFGKVYKAIDLTDKSICAVKVISKLVYNNTTPEQDIYLQLNHPNIVRCKRITENKKYYYIIMEYMEGGTLAQKMKEKQLNEQEAAIIMKSILEGVNYLHDRSIIHRDIKPENIMLTGTNVKIADFGLSFKFSSTEGTFHKLLNKKCGTIIYMAPEQFTEKYYSKQVDVWSCGILLYMLLNGGIHPFYNKDDTKYEFIKKILNPSIDIPSNMTPLAKDLFYKLINVNPIDRYNVSQALMHPWITRKFHEKIPLTYQQQLDQFLKEQQIRQQFKLLFFLQYINLNSPRTQIFSDNVKELEQENQQLHQNQTSASPTQNKFKILQLNNKHKNQCNITHRMESQGKFLDFSLTQKTHFKKSMENILVFEKDKYEKSQNFSARSLKQKSNQIINKFFIPTSFQESFCVSNKMKSKQHKKLLPPLKSK